MYLTAIKLLYRRNGDRRRLGTGQWIVVSSISPFLNFIDSLPRKRDNWIKWNKRLNCWMYQNHNNGWTSCARESLLPWGTNIAFENVEFTRARSNGPLSMDQIWMSARQDGRLQNRVVAEIHVVAPLCTILSTGCWKRSPLEVYRLRTLSIESVQKSIVVPQERLVSRIDWLQYSIRRSKESWDEAVEAAKQAKIHDTPL
jgi:hypothetical protein